MMFNKDKLNQLFEELGKQCVKDTEIIICGGASMVLNYETRESTRDVDCFMLEEQIKKVATKLAVKHELDFDWLNDNVCVTLSYHNGLSKYKTYYNRFGNLVVYTISGLPLLCMKLVSFREHSSDVEDCRNLIALLKSKYSVKDVMGTFSEIYKDTSLMSVDAELFLTKEFEGSTYMLDEESVNSYCDMINKGLIALSDIPSEIKEQIIETLSKRKNKKVTSALESLSNL